MAITAARPSSRLCSTVTGKPSTPMSASLMASLANRGSDSSLASGRARVLLPDPGGPATSTKNGALRPRNPSAPRDPRPSATPSRIRLHLGPAQVPRDLALDGARREAGHDALLEEQHDQDQRYRA